MKAQKLLQIFLPSFATVTVVICIVALLVSRTYADPPTDPPIISLPDEFCYGVSLDKNSHLLTVSSAFSINSPSALTIIEESTGKEVSFTIDKVDFQDVNGFTIELEEKSQSGASYIANFHSGFLISPQGSPSLPQQIQLTSPPHNRFIFRDLIYFGRDFSGFILNHIGENRIALLETRKSSLPLLHILDSEGKIISSHPMNNAEGIQLWDGSNNTLLVSAVISGQFTIMKMDATGEVIFSYPLSGFTYNNTPAEKIVSVWETPNDIRIIHLTDGEVLQAELFTKGGVSIGRTVLARQIKQLNLAFVPFESGGGLLLAKTSEGFQFISFGDVMSNISIIPIEDTGLTPYLKSDTQVLALARTGSEITVCLGDTSNPLFGIVKVIRLNPQYRLISGSEYKIDAQNLSKNFHSKVSLLVEGSGDFWLGIPGDGVASILLQVNQFNRVTDWKTLNGQTLCGIIPSESGGINLAVTGAVSGLFYVDTSGRETTPVVALDGDIKSLLSGVVTQNMKGSVIQLMNRFDALSEIEQLEVVNLPLLNAAVEDLAIIIEEPVEDTSSHVFWWTIAVSLLIILVLLSVLFFLNTKKILIKSPIHQFDPLEDDPSEEKLTDEAFERILRDLEEKY